MRLALIPPKGMEDDTLRSHIHLALAQNDWPEYNKAYDEAMNRHDFIIVDNGAAEGAPVLDHELMQAASRLHAQEIVVPDVIRRHDETMERAETFFHNVKRTHYIGDYQYMGVVQGINIEEVRACIWHFADNPNIKTIGIPRHLITTLRTPGVRLEIAGWIKDRFGNRFAIHFLGTNRSYLRELFYAGKYHAWIRSVDTSAPFIYAVAGKMLPRDPKGKMEILERAEDYFAAKSSANAYIVGHNVEVLNAWCRGEHGS